MAKLTVTALKMGVLLLEKGFDGVDMATPICQPVWAAAISGADRKILVDTGLHDAAWISANCIPCEIEADEFMSVALAHIGWRVEDVDIVINTHLHYDHIGNNPLFENADFYVGKRELETANNPPKSQAFLYEKTKQLYDARGVRPEAWHTIDGPCELVDGVRLIPTPGHTDGHISVLVDTAQGIVCVAGDAVMFMENLELGYCNRLYTDRAASLHTVENIRTLADRVFPGHSERITKFQNRDFPLIPKVQE